MLLKLGSLIFLLCFTFPAFAVLDIEVTGAGEHQTPVSVVPFEGEDRLDQRISEVVSNDLTRTGLFKLVPPEGKITPQPERSTIFRLAKC
jgi:TolB protein